MDDENSLYDWKAFYTKLGRLGSKMLVNVDPGLLSYITETARDSDAFFSDSLYDTLEAWWYDNPKRAVKESLKVWLRNVKRHVKEIVGPLSLDTMG